jgi:hypothetical protein
MKRASDASPVSRSAMWPDLPLEAWRDTYATLHRWTQIVGKVRLARAPHINHWWEATLYLTARGLTTSPMPYGQGTFQIDFDFLDHRLRIDTSTGATRTLVLQPRSVANFYDELMTVLRALGIAVRIWTMPQEVEEPIRFEQDTLHASYDPDFAQKHWRILVQAGRLMTLFRSRFLGKCSPVHFFWGAFDMAVTRFSGRRAPQHPGGVPHLADRIAREAYSHEVSSCGFWPGGGPLAEPAFYAYAYPEPAGFRDYPVDAKGAFYHDVLREYILPYQAVRQADDPDELLLAFFQRTYEAAADLGRWNRAELERTPP